MGELEIKTCYLCGRQFRTVRQNQIYCDNNCTKLQNKLWNRGITMDAFVDSLMTEPKAQNIEVLSVVKEYLLNKCPERLEDFNIMVRLGDIDKSGMAFIDIFKDNEKKCVRSCEGCDREYRSECGCAKLINFGHASQYQKMPDVRCVNRERRVYA